MFDREHLNLQLVRLKPPEDWIPRENGLSFLFGKGGVGQFVVGSVTRSLAAGDVLVLDGASKGKLCAAKRDGVIFSCFSASLEHMFPLLISSEIPLLQKVADDFRSSKLYPASTPLARECHRLLEEAPPQSGLDHRGHLLRIIATILSAEFETAHGQRVGFVRSEDHMAQVFERLSTEEILKLSVEELAGKFSCSRRHLNRLFHHHFGFSVAALRMEMRLLKAVSLLRNPDAKVINVADECGFNHLGLFNTCFKRRFGASPGQYRKMNVPVATGGKGLAPGGEGCPLHFNGLCPWTGGPGNVQPAPPTTAQAPNPHPARAPKSGGSAPEGGKPPTAGLLRKPPAGSYRLDASQEGT